MSLFSSIIRTREENNIRLEADADQALVRNRKSIRIEDPIEDAQTTVLFILERFGLSLSRIHACPSLPVLLDSLLGPVAMMYEYSEDVAGHSKKKTEFIMAFREDGKAVALYPSGTGYRYFCPSDSGGGLATAKYCSSLQKGCYVFCRPFRERSTILGSFLWNVLNTMTVGDIFRLLAATCLVTALGLVIPLVNQWVYKKYIGAGSSAASGLIVAILIFVSATAARAGISSVKSLMLFSVKVRVSMDIQSAVMAKVMHLPYSFFKETSSGKLSQRVSSSSRLSDIILDIFMDVLLNLTFSLVYLVQLNYLAPVLFLPALFFMALKIVASVISALLNKANESEILELEMEYKGFLYSSVKGIQKLKGLGAEIFIYSKWADMYRRRLSLEYRQPFFLKHNTEIYSAISIFTTIFLLYRSIESGLFTADYLSFISSYTLVMTVVSSLMDIMENMFLTGFLCRNVYPVFHAETEESQDLEYIQNLRGDIRLDDIHFAYDNDSRGCLNGISVHIKSGEKLAVVGESGCGKSTLLKILIGMEKPDFGSIYYDGKLLASINPKSLRKCIGSVYQFSKVFPGTIADNIAFGSIGEPDEKNLWEAADNAALGDYIRSLPLSMYTEVSETNSCGFSGGQRQQILLARAMYSRPRVLLLDEATSALDNVTQDAVLKNILKMKSTVVMAAHRLSTVENFDRIIMIENGMIVEEGTFSSLMEKNGRFAQLVRKQIVKNSK